MLSISILSTIHTNLLLSNKRYAGTFRETAIENHGETKTLTDLSVFEILVIGPEELRSCWTRAIKYAGPFEELIW